MNKTISLAVEIWIEFR